MGSQTPKLLNLYEFINFMHDFSYASTFADLDVFFGLAEDVVHSSAKSLVNFSQLLN